MLADSTFHELDVELLRSLADLIVLFQAELGTSESVLCDVREPSRAPWFVVLAMLVGNSRSVRGVRVLCRVPD